MRLTGPEDDDVVWAQTYNPLEQLKHSHMCWSQGHKQEEWHLKTLYLRVTGSKKLNDYEKGIVSVVEKIGVLGPRLEDLQLGRFEEKFGKMMDGLPIIGKCTSTGEWDFYLVHTGTGENGTSYSLQEALDEMALPKSLRVFDPCIVLRISSKRLYAIIPQRGQTQQDYYRVISLQGDDYSTSTTPYHDVIEYEIKYRQAILAIAQKTISSLPNLQEGSVWEIHKSVDGREDGWLRWTWRKTPQSYGSDPALATSNIVIDISPVLYTKYFTGNYRSGRIGRFLPEDEDDDSD